MYLARKHTSLSFPEIGRAMGDKNHSTVILANRRIAKMLEEDAWVCRQTAAGPSEERLREILLKIEQQLGLACSDRTKAEGPSVQAARDSRLSGPETDSYPRKMPVRPPSATGLDLPGHRIAAG